MQLRPRDGNGRAITSKDGLIRDFKKIIDRDELDPMPEVPVKGGQMYYFKTALDAQGKQLTKIVPYDAERNKEKKVPKFKSNYTKVDNLVQTAAAATPVDYEKIRTLKKLYVDDLKAITSVQFERMLKEHGVIEKVEPGDNVTNHDDLKKFVTEAIKTYKEVHPNRKIDLKASDYKKYINKVLKRVRKQYYIDVTGVMPFDSTGTKQNTEKSCFGGKNTLHNAGTSAVGTDVSTELTTYNTVAKVNTQNDSMNIVADIDDDTTELTTSTTLTPILLITKWSQEREDLVQLIKELYKIFIEQTQQQLKEKPELGFQFSDGGKKKGGRSGKTGRSGKKVKKNRSRSRKH